MKAEHLDLGDLDAGVVRDLIGDRVFASPGFAEVWKATGGRPRAWAFRVEGRLGAILPGVETGRGPLLSFLAMPDGCYSGVFVDPALTGERERLAAGLLDAVAGHRYARRIIFDFYGTLPRHPRFEITRCETVLLSIDGPDWMPDDPKLQSQFRKAEREGIAVEAFDWERHHEGFLKLVETTERRHGAPEPRYPPAFYRALADLARRDERVHWVWCEHEGRPACSHIYIVEGGVLQGWQIYFDKAFSFLKPNQYIRIATCRRMAARGVTRLNLGATPEGAPGLAYYKGRWGGDPYPFAAFTKMSRVGKLYRTHLT